MGRKKNRPKHWAESPKYGFNSHQWHYQSYIKTNAWKMKRREAFKAHGEKCHICGSKEYLEVHHLSYKNLGNEKMNELQVLCRGCHENEHEYKGFCDPITRRFLALVAGF